MPASVPGLFNIQQFTDAGVLASNYRLYTYVQGTTTFKAAYTDIAGVVPHTYVSDGIGGQYIALNARGELPAPLYLASGAYDITLKTPSGATVWTRRADGMGDFSIALAASSGSSLVGFIQAGTGAILRTMQAKAREMEVSVLDYGADPTGVADSYAAFQLATNYIQSNPLGGVVFIPRGSYLISGGTVTNDRVANSALGRVSYVGEDMNSTRITYSGAGANCFYLGNNQTAAGEQNASYQIVSDLTILGPALRANSAGIVMNLGAFPKFERLNIQGFDYGMYLQDVDQVYFEKVNLRFNSRGLFGTKSLAPGASSTQPNNWTYVSCSFSNNGSYGAQIVGASAHTWIGGDIEYNGATIGASGFGISFNDSGYEGGVGANMQGVYFEGNRGIADVILVGSTVNATPLLGVVHKLSGCTFHRNGVNPNTYNVLCSFGADATVGKQQLVLNGCAFKTFSTYVPNAGTPNIFYALTPVSITNFFDHGSFYGAAVEKPSFIQNLNKKETLITKTALQTFTNAVTAKWLVDLLSSPSPLWSPAIATGDVTIDETGTYAISVTLPLSTATAGLKVITILRGVVTIGTGETAGANNIISASCIARFTAGDLLKINYIQVTGANQDITAASGMLSIAKIF